MLSRAIAQTTNSYVDHNGRWDYVNEGIRQCHEVLEVRHSMSVVVARKHQAN